MTPHHSSDAIVELHPIPPTDQIFPYFWPERNEGQVIAPLDFVKGIMVLGWRERTKQYHGALMPR